MVWELRFTQKFDIFIQGSHLFVEIGKLILEMQRDKNSHNNLKRKESWWTKPLSDFKFIIKKYTITFTN